MRPGDPSTTQAVASAPPQFALAVEEIARLTLAESSPTEYFRNVLQIALPLLAAPAGTVWLRNEQGLYRRQGQLTPSDGELALTESAKAAHAEMLRQAVQQARPLCLAPQDQNGFSPRNGASASVGSINNPTEWTILFVPIFLDRQVEGFWEVWQEPQDGAQAVGPQMALLIRLADLASVYLLHHRRQQQTTNEQLGERIDAFAKRVHGSLDPAEVGILIANEGKTLIGCDRLGVAVRQGRKAKIEAISGVDVVQQRSNLAQRLRRLCDEVLRWGERLIYRGVPDETLPPAVLEALDAYLEESHCKLLIVLPLHDEREKKTKRKPRSALVMECFETQVPPEQMLSRLEIIAQHATSALYNAAAHKRVPLRFLWRPIEKVQEGLGGKTKAILAAVAVAVFILINVLIFVPYPLKLSAKGQLLPEERHWVYAPVEGQVVDFAQGIEPGASVSEGQPLILMHDVQLEHKLVQLQSEAAAAKQDAAALQQQINAAATEQDRLRLSADQQQKAAVHKRKQQELNTFKQRTNSDPARPGHFWVRSPMRGIVLNADFKETLRNRQVKPSEPLLRLGDQDKDWEIELKIPQKHVGQVASAFASDDPKAEADVDLLVTSEPTRVYKGKLRRAKLAAEANPNKDNSDEAEPVVLAFVRIDGDDLLKEDRIPPRLLTAGVEVHAKVRCGNHAMGYSLFYGIWEWFFEKVLFFF